MVAKDLQGRVSDMVKFSYAPNFEDIYLARAFSGIDGGFYIDVGPTDPEINSCTKMFYDRGWSGIHVGVGAAAERFRALRQRDQVYEHGRSLQVHTAAKDGAAVLKFAIAGADRRSFSPVKDREGAVTLAALLGALPEGRSIQFLRLDCDGAEEAVVASIDWGRHRPEVLLITAKRPHAPGRTDAGIVERLTAAGYTDVFFDGVNAYFLRQESKSRAHAFTAPVHGADMALIAPLGLEAALLRSQEADLIPFAVAQKVREAAYGPQRLRALGAAERGDVSEAGVELRPEDVVASLSMFVRILAAQLESQRQFSEQALAALSRQKADREPSFGATQVSPDLSSAESDVTMAVRVLQLEEALAHAEERARAAAATGDDVRAGLEAVAQAERAALIEERDAARRLLTHVELNHLKLVAQFENLAAERFQLYQGLTSANGPRAVRFLLPLARVLRFLAGTARSKRAKMRNDFAATHPGLFSSLGKGLAKAVVLPVGLFFARRFPSVTRSLWMEVRTRAPDLTSEGLTPLPLQERPREFVRAGTDADPALAAQVEAALLTLALHKEIDADAQIPGRAQR